MIGEKKNPINRTLFFNFFTDHFSKTGAAAGFFFTDDDIVVVDNDDDDDDKGFFYYSFGCGLVLILYCSFFSFLIGWLVVSDSYDDD